jgi:hypothetical protein
MITEIEKVIEENKKLKEFIKRLKANRTSYSLYTKQVKDDKIWEEIQKEFNIT